MIINRIMNKTKIIGLGKDTIDPKKRSNVVYKITCGSCPATYIGETKRYLGTRLKEHARYIKNENTNSVIFRHISENEGHFFDFGSAQVVDVESFPRKRKFSEMINICFHDNTINRIEDTQFLQTTYKTAVKSIKNNCMK